MPASTKRPLAPGYHSTSQYFMDTLRVIAFMEEAELSGGKDDDADGIVMVEARPSMVGDEYRPSIVEPIVDFSSATTVQEVNDACEAMLGYKVKPFQEAAKWVRPPTYKRLGKRLPFKLAIGPSDITPEWCTEVFRYQGYIGMEESVTSIKIQPIGAGEGEFSELALVDIDGVQSATGAPKLPRSLIAKFSPPGLGGFQLSFTFGSESHFYNDLSDEGAALPAVAPLTACDRLPHAPRHTSHTPRRTSHMPCATTSHMPCSTHRSPMHDAPRIALLCPARRDARAARGSLHWRQVLAVEPRPLLLPHPERQPARGALALL